MSEFISLETKNEMFFSNKNIPFVIVRMTSNILSHFIFDATKEMRQFLKDSGIHDFNCQGFGQEHKVYIKTHILTFSRVVESQTSLYRSGSRGDFRMWFGSPIVPLTSPEDKYLVCANSAELYIINISQVDVEKCCQSSFPSPLKLFLNTSIK